MRERLVDRRGRQPRRLDERRRRRKRLLLHGLMHGEGRRRGPTEHCERELKLDACLSTWGAAHTMKMLCLAADGKLS